jgi:predicted nucleic acid-binding protein
LITAVDSSALLDILKDDPDYGASSLGALRAAAALGPLVVCPIVWAELRGSFADAVLMERAFSEARIAFDPFDRECADIAGAHWHEYRQRGGSRTRLIADFFIGAHAQRRGGRLITRDRGFYRRYFVDLTVIDGLPPGR